MGRKAKGYSELIVAVWRDDTELAKRLLQDGHDVNATDIDGRTPLMHAASRGRLTILRLLLQHRANVSLQDHGGFSALHFAAQNFEVTLAEELLRAGAQLELKDSYGNTPLWLALVNSQGKGEMIRLLLKNGANPDAKNNQGKSCMDLANSVANYDLKQFFSKGSEV